MFIGENNAEGCKRDPYAIIDSGHELETDCKQRPGLLIKPRSDLAVSGVAELMKLSSMKEAAFKRDGERSNFAAVIVK